jgi:hypothetical protein
MTKQEKKTPILLSETETDHVAGGAGHHVGQRAQLLDVPAWTLNPGKAEEAPGHS